MVGEPQVAMRVTSQIWHVVFASQTLSVFCFSLRKKAQYVVVLGSTWVITKAMIDTSGPVVEQCILNQTKRYWILSNALFSAFSICSKMHKEYQIRASLNSPLMCGKFDAKLEILYDRMTLDVINVLEPFLAFVVTFNGAATHNMCAFQLDPWFKGL
jgi:hypothetical protein